MNDINLFVVQSPFQLLSAIEAANYFNNDNNVLIVRFTGEKINNGQIERLLKFFRWTKVIHVEHLFSLTITEVKLAYYLNEIRKNNRILSLFIGEARSGIMQAFINNLNYNNCFLLDDGVSTVVINAVLRNNGFDLSELVESSTINSLINRFLYRIWNISLKPARLPVNWFTCFNIAAINNERVIRHRFEYLNGIKVRREVAEFEDAIFFIGSNLAGIGIINLRDEMMLLKIIADKYLKAGIQVIYCSHRRESKEKLEAINSIYNVKVRSSDLPIEMAFMLHDEHPSRIATFYSSALQTLNIVYNPKYVKAFRLPKDMIAIGYRESVNKAYAYLEQEGFIVENIEYNGSC